MAVMPFTFARLAIAEVVTVTPRVFADERGSFAELYVGSVWRSAGLPASFVQCNRSVSVKGVLRGLHYQLPPAAQGKLIRVVRGEIFDVAVDIRRTARTFGQWVGITLSAAGERMVYIPEGFAHGFCVLSDEGAEVLYFCTAEYAPSRERGIVWNDPRLGIRWPVVNPRVAARDAAFPPLAKAELTSD